MDAAPLRKGTIPFGLLSVWRSLQMMVDLLINIVLLINIPKMPPDLENIMMAAVILEKSEFVLNTLSPGGNIQTEVVCTSAISISTVFD